MCFARRIGCSCKFQNPIHRHIISGHSTLESTARFWRSSWPPLLCAFRRTPVVQPAEANGSELRTAWWCGRRCCRCRSSRTWCPGWWFRCYRCRSFRRWRCRCKGRRWCSMSSAASCPTSPESRSAPPLHSHVHAPIHFFMQRLCPKKHRKRNCAKKT